jgi:hypothetical protein
MSSTTRVPDVNFSLSTLLRQPTTYRGPLLAFTITEETGVSVFRFIPLINYKYKTGTKSDSTVKSTKSDTSCRVVDMPKKMVSW